MMNARALAFLSVVSVGACGGETHVESVSSEAVLKENGLKYNGLKYNGLKYNGLKYNGLKYNGMGLSGLSLAASGASLYEVKVDKGTLVAKLSNGTIVSGMGLLGTTLVSTLENGTTVKVNIAEMKSTVNAEIL